MTVWERLAIGLAIFSVAITMLGLLGGLIACYHDDPACRGPYYSGNR